MPAIQNEKQMFLFQETHKPSGACALSKKALPISTSTSAIIISALPRLFDLDKVLTDPPYQIKYLPLQGTTQAIEGLRLILMEDILDAIKVSGPHGPVLMTIHAGPDGPAFSDIRPPPFESTKQALRRPLHTNARPLQGKGKPSMACPRHE